MGSWRRIECLGGIVFQIGKATKRSRFGDSTSDQISKTLESTEFCIKSDFDFHFIDAEWTHNYPSGSEIDRLLTYCEEQDSDITTVFTVNARHSPALDVLSEFSEVAAQHGNAGFCFVAGNPAYLSTEERGLDAKSRIAQMVETTRERLEAVPIFVGAEGQSDLAAGLAFKYKAIPFMLLDASVQNRVSQFTSTINGGVGVYCPYLLSSGTEEERVRSLGLYALRRRWVRDSLRKVGLRVADVRAQVSDGLELDEMASEVLTDALGALALCDEQDFQNRLGALSSVGVRYAAFLPAIESIEEHERLSELISDSRA